jgi:integrase
LRLRDLDRPRSTVWLREKFGIEREQPISPSLLQALETDISDAPKSPFRKGR